ncbi:cellulose binding domain-containing protein, partial [Hamadaea sp. NPDC051192]|uniref:cellulose binding domain-containing protein n=1 Tax=Hamadaea sp. NPDC051192 TaxID=3154940 RepID=UPI003416BA04
MLRIPRRPRAVLVLSTAAALTATSLTATTLVASAAAAGCRVEYAVASQWAGGFGANITITNLGDPISGWTLRWTFPAGQTVTQGWNGTFTQSGADVTVTDAGYNAAIATNGSTAIGFNGSWNNVANTDPTSFTLNGVACTGSVPASPTASSSASASPSTSPTTSSPSPSTSTSPPVEQGRQMEKLNRGVTSVHSSSGNMVSWRLLGTDPASVTFNLYR